MQCVEDGSLVVVNVPGLQRSTKPQPSNMKPEEAIVNMNGSDFYFEEWTRLFKEPNYLSIIKNRAFTGGLRSCRFRSICWRVYLHCLPDDQSQWQAASQLTHKRYESLKSEILINPRTDTLSLDPMINNPLSQEETSPWNQYFQDTELKLTIRQDVIRTFPEVEFFQSPEIREIMVNILFCYARQHPQIAYRQGMHELLAPLIFVLHSDQQAFLHAVEIAFIEETLQQLLNPAYLEHDAYNMFCNLMDNVESWYIMRDVNVSKLSYIHEFLLRRHDQELYTHLEKMEIAPQIYGIRWLRLLFGREFSLQDLLVIWDVIFADGSNFGLVDYIFISMLGCIRNLLLSGDYATCLGYLMRYPTVADVHYIIDMALHLRDPRKHPKPTAYNNPMHIPTVGGRPDIHRAPMSQNLTTPQKENKLPEKWNAISSGFSTLTHKTASRPRSLRVSNSQTVAAANEPVSPELLSSSPEMDHVRQEETGNSAKASVADKNSSIVRSYPSLANVETEMQPMMLKNYEERSSTLPRSFGLHDRCGRGNDLRDPYPKDIPQSAEEAIPANLPTRMTRHDSLKATQHVRLGTHKQKSDQEVNYLQGQLNDLQSMSSYCAQKMTAHIDRLQECILKQNLEEEDEMLIALAGLKQVRDILKGTLKFSHNLLDGDDIVIDDDHYDSDQRGRPATAEDAGLFKN